MNNNYKETYYKLYNLWVEHDNLMGDKVDWNFAERICNDYIDASIRQKTMSEWEAQSFKKGWNEFTYHMFD